MNANDLISRAAAIDALTDTNLKRNVDSVCDGDMNRTRRAAQRVIAQLPAVDAAPGVHGKWVKVHGYITPGGDPVWACSECGKGVHVYGIEHGTYGLDIADGQWVSCPNCGAVMKEEQD